MAAARALLSSRLLLAAAAAALLFLACAAEGAAAVAAGSSGGRRRQLQRQQRQVQYHLKRLNKAPLASIQVTLKTSISASRLPPLSFNPLRLPLVSCSSSMIFLCSPVASEPMEKRKEGYVNLAWKWTKGETFFWVSFMRAFMSFIYEPVALALEALIHFLTACCSWTTMHLI